MQKLNRVDKEKISGDLNLDNGASLGECGFEEIVRTLCILRPHDIVEFGSGASSVRLALEFPECSILSIEHDPMYFDRTVALKSRFQPQAHMQVELRSLAWQRHSFGWYYSYSVGFFPKCIDVVIVDGPPYYTIRGREACLYQTFDRLKVGGLVILHDYIRQDEQRIVANWLLSYRDCFKVRVAAIGDQMCVLTKVRDQKRRATTRVTADNVQQCLRMLKGRAMTVFRHMLSSLRGFSL